MATSYYTDLRKEKSTKTEQPRLVPVHPVLAKVLAAWKLGSESVVSDIDGKIRQARAQGREAWYCIMDGQDTARILRAYGEL